MGHFKLKNKIKLSEITSDTVITESDYATITPEGVFVQLEYFDEDDSGYETTIVKPGIFTIAKTMVGLKLVHTDFNKDSILENFVYTKEIENRIDTFLIR